jgi:hypothetical protein
MSGMKDCKFCEKNGLLWLPLRYSAVVSADAQALATLPALTGKLGQGVTDVKLKNAKYAARLLRPGYLYVLIDRKGLKYWEAYMVLEDAFLYKFDIANPPTETPAFSCERHTCGINASMVSIPNANDVATVWALFTHSQMTATKLDEYKTNADAYVAQGKMQTFSPAAWLNKQTAQPHTLLAPELLTRVAEYVLFNQPGNPLGTPLGNALETQLFVGSKDAYAGVPPDAKGHYAGRLGNIYNKIKHDGHAAFVLYDHIGITQELNDFRNAALQPVEKFLAKVDAKGVSNQRKLEVSQAIADVEKGYVEHGMGAAKRHIEQMDAAPLPNIDEDNAKTLRSLGRIKEAEALEARAQRSRTARDASRQRMLSGADAAKEWADKYAKLLDKGELDKFRNELASISDACGKVADQRVDDHLLWLDAARLVDAFDVYDPANLGSGFCFTQDHMLCTFGMFGVDKNKPKLAEWLKVSKVERKNLYMRANLYNQKSLQEEAGKAFTEAQAMVAAAGGLGHVASPPFLKAVKGLVDVLKKTDSAWDEWLRDKVVKSIHEGKTKPIPGNKIHNLSTFHRGTEGVMYARMSEWTQALSNKAGKMDKAIQGIVGTLIFSRLGELAEKIGIEEYMLKIKAEKIAELKAKKQKTAEYQARADEQKRTAKSNIEKAEAAARPPATARAKAELAQIDDSIDLLLQDEQRKVRDKVKIALDEMDKGARPETNNFRQARMGVLLMGIEGLALALKLSDEKELSEKGKWEVRASILSLSGITIDIIYSVAKSLREVAPVKDLLGVSGALDVVRGGLKMTAGTLSAAAGGISAVLDWQEATKELDKDRTNWVLTSVYFSRSFAGAFSAGLGLIAAFSYTGPLLLRMSGSGAAVATRLAPVLRTVGTYAVEKVAIARTLWLIRVARFNMIGLTITAGEVIYRCWIMDDELEDWCEACTFRKDKSQGWSGGKPYPDAKKELEELDKAFKAIAA